jgi:hypothetical protein
MRDMPDNMDVLQNIESAVSRAFRADPSLTDYSVLRVYQALIEFYSAEILNRQPRPQNLDEKDSQFFEAVKQACENRLEREPATEEDTETFFYTITTAEMLSGLKRLASSVERWTRRHGRQGYLKFISQFVF